MQVDGFDWDQGNREKCRRHGVTISEIEAVFAGSPTMRPDHAHSSGERRLSAIGRIHHRHVFVVFTIRTKDGRQLVRPISARYMHRKEIERYEKDNPAVKDNPAL